MCGEPLRSHVNYKQTLIGRFGVNVSGQLQIDCAVVGLDNSAENIKNYTAYPQMVYLWIQWLVKVKRNQTSRFNDRKRALP